MKKLVIDVETRPNLAWIWNLWGDQRVGLNQVAEAGSVISFAAKWHGAKKVMFYSDHHDGHDEMVAAAHRLINEADALIHYNGSAFDVKLLNREFLLANLAPPMSPDDIDLLRVMKKRFKFPSNALASVSHWLELGQKTPHTGFDLWRDCMMGDEKAWGLMKRYNIQDVRLTEDLYDRLLPWIPNHPNVALYNETPDACPQCGKGPLWSKGLKHTKTLTYRRMQCQSCFAPVRVRVSEPMPRPLYV